MGKVLSGWVLMVVGAFLLVAAALLIVWAPSAAQRTPLNVDTVTMLTGTAQHLDPSTGSVADDPVIVRNVTKADPKKSTSKYVAFVATTCLNVDKGSGADQCLKGTDTRVITNSDPEVFATDRHTAMASNALHLGKGSEDYRGLVNKWPFNTKKKDYQVYDGTLNKTVTAKYAGTRTIDGLKTYAFKTSVGPSPATVVSTLKGNYSDDETYWIDPTTGSIIDNAKHEVRTLTDGSTVLDLSVRYTKGTVSHNVSEAKSNDRLLGLIGGPLPWVVGILGIVLVVVGGLIVRAGRRTATA